jgi:hypothetical protein
MDVKTIVKISALANVVCLHCEALVGATGPQRNSFILCIGTGADNGFSS